MSEERVRVDLDQAERASERAEDFEGEGRSRSLSGFPKTLLAALGVLLSCYALYWVLNPVTAQVYRTSFLAIALFMTFMLFRGWGSRREGEADNPGVSDWLLGAASIVALGYTLVVFDEFVRRAARPNELDILFGIITILLVLEAARRTSGLMMPLFCVFALAYAYLGALIPTDWNVGHVGYGVGRIVGQTYMGLEGIFGVPLDVAATYLVLFTLYGAVLEASGASRYFLNLSFSAFGSSNSGPGRTTALSGYLLGSVSGSGTAVAVTLASVLWPILRRAGYSREGGGGVLAASGIGAIIAPPTMGAAAFIIAEFLGVSYLQVIVYAIIPAFLYYFGILLAVEADARRLRIRGVEVETDPFWYLLLRFGYYFSSLFVIVGFLIAGFSPFRSVFYAIIAAFLLSFLSRETMMTPRKIWGALSSGAAMALPVAAITAAAGIIVAVITLTGLGLKLSSIIVALAGGTLFLTTLYAAFAILLIGLAVPVTASFIIASVIIAPAFTTLGVEQYAAYMFIFYYAVLSEVSPPTALAAVATSAITGGNALATMWTTWKYTLPAFLVPFAFVLSPNGRGLLFQGDPGQILFAFAASAVAVTALAVATGAWLFGPARWPERIICGAAGLILLYLEPFWVAVGVGVFATGILVHFILRKVMGKAEPPPRPQETETEDPSEDAREPVRGEAE